MTGSHQCGGRLLPAPSFYFRPETHGKAICRPFFLSSFTKQRQRLVNRCKSDRRDRLCFFLNFFFCWFLFVSCLVVLRGASFPLCGSLSVIMSGEFSSCTMWFMDVHCLKYLLLMVPHMVAMCSSLNSSSLLFALFPMKFISSIFSDLLGRCWKIFTEKKSNRR